ncbi:MAG: acyl-ACP thioesterase [Treponema sp.]|nr:acyl-ACP thioesterase [Treponema sp.]
MNCNAANPKACGKVDIWQENYPVRFGVIDRSDRLTLSGIFQFFQEAAISHAENLCVGREDMARTGQVWILSRMSVQVDRRPNYCESITVRTWPRGGEKLFALRDFDIRDKDGIAVVSARSGWIIIDMEKRRPLRPQLIMDALPLNEGVDALNYGPVGLGERVGLVKTGERKALYTDIDYNGHVNNTRYVQWIEDSIDPQLLEKTCKMRFDINYLTEILSGENAEILCAPVESENETVFAFESCKTNGQTAFRAELRLTT